MAFFRRTESSTDEPAAPQKEDEQIGDDQYIPFFWPDGLPKSIYDNPEPVAITWNGQDCLATYQDRGQVTFSGNCPACGDKFSHNYGFHDYVEMPKILFCAVCTSLDAAHNDITKYQSLYDKLIRHLEELKVLLAGQGAGELEYEIGLLGDVKILQPQFAIVLQRIPSKSPLEFYSPLWIDDDGSRTSKQWYDQLTRFFGPIFVVGSSWVFQTNTLVTPRNINREHIDIYVSAQNKISKLTLSHPEHVVQFRRFLERQAAAVLATNDSE